MSNNILTTQWFRNKGSKYRHKIAICLKLWKKNRCVGKTAKTLKMTYATIEKALSFSKFYVKYYKNYIARDTPKSIKLQMKEKGSRYRNKVAVALITWRKTHSIIKTAKTLKTYKSKIRNLLKASRFFILTRHKYKIIKDGRKEWINKKGTHYRSKIASCLKLWRINKSISKTAKILKINKTTICFLLRQSRIYREIRKNITAKYKTRRKNKHYDTDYILRWAKKIKAINLLGGECKKCGNNNIFHLEFHHIKNNKKREIDKSWSLKWTTIRKEIYKCILLCRNCHASFHHSLSKRSKKSIEYKTKLLKLKGIYKCEKCNYNKSISSIDFHHKNDHNGKKEFNIGNYYRNQKKSSCTKRLLRELRKCLVLCKNCHKVEHINIEKFYTLKKYIDEAIIAYFEGKH